MGRKYTRPWIVDMIDRAFAPYPKAEAYLSWNLGIERREVVERFFRDEIRWDGFKKMVRELEEALHACVVVSVEKVEEKWENVAKPLDVQLEFFDNF